MGRGVSSVVRVCGFMIVVVCHPPSILQVGVCVWGGGEGIIIQGLNHMYVEAISGFQPQD